MKSILLTTVLAVAVALPAAAQQNRRSELSLPIVAYTPIIAKNVEALELNEAQRADLKAWLEAMPAKRKAMESEAVALRAQLREAINAGAPQEERQALAEKVGAAETKLVMMRSACTDHWRDVLSEAQFARVLQLAAAGN